jgi:DNA replication and repair protein RecF
LIALGAPEARLSAVVEREGLERHYQLTIRPRGREVRLDGKTVRPIARYFGDFNVVLFAPEDLAVPKGSPGDRRRFLDRAAFNHDRGFLPTAQSFDKVLRSRNALLRDCEGHPDREVLAVYDRQVAEWGARLSLARQRYVATLSPLFGDAYESITRAGLEGAIAYESSFELPVERTEVAVATALHQALRASLRRDLARKSTSVGPQRDDLHFRLAGQPAASFASQGQLRALVLAWKTAEMTLLESSHANAPILLLDDVSSELDASRNQYLFAFLRERENQCFITTTAAKHVLIDSDRVDFEVRQGEIART